MSLSLKNARVIRRDGSIEGPKDIVIQDGLIKEVRESGAARSGEVGVNETSDELAGYPRPDSTVDCTGLYVSPGLVNLHTHSPMAIFRGLAEDVNIEEWFNVKIWPYESRLRPHDVKIGAMLDIYEMLDCGVTAFCDHYFYSDEIVKAAKEGGIRADIAPTIFGLAPDWEKSLDEAAFLVEKANCSNVTMRIGPHAPYTCPPKVLEKCVEVAKKLKVGIHVHVSETEKQVKESLREFGKTPFQVLYDAGVMEVPCLFAHGVFIQEKDLALLNERCYFALAPKTYMKLASGFGNIISFLPKINAGLGTDGAASSNTQGPLEQARLLALYGKKETRDARAFDLKTVWRILMKGHDALGKNTGDVAPGYAADLVVWDLQMAHTWPVYEPLGAIIYSADSRNIRHVLVAGEFRKKDGGVMAFNIQDLLKEAGQIKERLLKEGAGKAKVTY